LPIFGARVDADLAVADLSLADADFGYDISLHRHRSVFGNMSEFDALVDRRASAPA